MIRGGQSCRVPNRLLQKFAKGRGIFSDSLWIAVAHDIEALAAIQNEIQFISHLCASIFALIVGDELKRMNLVKSCRSLEPIAVKDQIRRLPPLPEKPLPLVKNDGNCAGVKPPACCDREGNTLC